MSGAAAAALPLDGLADVLCTAPVPWPRASAIHAPTGFRTVRRCVLPDGHLDRDVPCRYDWFEEHVDVVDDLGDELEETF